MTQSGHALFKKLRANLRGVIRNSNIVQHHQAMAHEAILGIGHYVRSIHFVGFASGGRRQKGSQF